jgi:hypothetical protein
MIGGYYGYYLYGMGRRCRTGCYGIARRLCHGFPWLIIDISKLENVMVAEKSITEFFGYDSHSLNVEWDESSSKYIAPVLQALNALLCYPSLDKIREYGWVMDSHAEDIWENVRNHDISREAVTAIVAATHAVYTGMVEKLDREYTDEIFFLVSDSHGIYSGYVLAEMIVSAQPGVFSGYNMDDVTVLLNGPETEGYWDALDSLFQGLKMEVSGMTHYIWAVDGGICAFPEDSPEGFWDRNNF